MSKIKTIPWLVLLWSMVSGFAHSQPEGVKVGSGLRLYPSIGVGYLFNSNFFATPEDEEFVAGSLIKPAIKLEKKTRRLEAAIGADAVIGDFDNGGQDDFTDKNLASRFHYQAGARHQFTGNAAFEEGHDPFGQRRTEGLPIADRRLDEYHTGRASIIYRYGAPNSLLNIEYQLSYLEREYDTNRELGTRFLDYDYRQHRGTFYWNYSPKTSAALRASRRDIEYSQTQTGFPDRTATEDRVALGVEWLPSGKTSGEFFVGRFKRNPDDPGFDDFSGSYWAVRAEWAPRKTTTLALASGRTTDEAFLVNSSVIDSKSTTASWQQRWNAIAASTVGIGYTERDFKAINRVDDYIKAHVELRLRVVKELHINFGVSYTERDSTLPVRNYDQSVLTVGFLYAP